MSNVNTTSVKLEWSFGFNGNSMITGVRVMYRSLEELKPDNGNVKFDRQFSRIIENLIPYTTYEFDIYAVNRVGESDPQSLQVQTLPLGNHNLLLFCIIIII